MKWYKKNIRIILLVAKIFEPPCGNRVARRDVTANDVIQVIAACILCLFRALVAEA